jgi:hypothetical protein
VIDILLVLAGVLLAILFVVTAYTVNEYRNRLKRAQMEYEKARDSVEDIVLSFNRELRREAERIEAVDYKVEGAASRADAGVKRAESLEQKVLPLEAQVSQLSTQIESMNTASEVNAQTLEKISGVDAKVHELETSQIAIRTKLSGMEEQIQKLSTAPEPRGDATLQPMPAIPLRRDKAMAALTETEIAVLEFLAAEGPKTAPEIKEKVQLSREHTARLMKRLYEEGYLERETGKLPFKYSVKSEMEKLLRKPEQTAT